MTALLEVEQLRISLSGAAGRVEAVRGVSFTVRQGATLGLIGESGCGKSLTALALMGLLPAGARAGGSVRLAGQQLIALDDTAWCQLRGRRVAMIFQEPMTALNPLQPIGRQIAEGLRLHQRLPAGAALAEALRLLDRVKLPDAARRLAAYPHQLSGGQRQRVMIAMALANRPALLIADEPTTALDVTLQREVLALIAELVAEDRMGLLLISHDLGVMAHSVQHLMVMYAGNVVEQGPTATLLRRPAHPYTRGLLAARPRLGLPRGTRLPTIPGRVPSLGELPAGCAFADRCDRVVAACRVAPPPALVVGADVGTDLGPAHAVHCLRPVH